MKPGDRAIHKKTGCVVDILTVTGAWCGCLFVFVPDQVVHHNWIAGRRRTFLLSELEKTGEI